MPDLPVLGQITLPSGTTYNIKDSKAREDIEELKRIISGGIVFIGETITPLTDGSTTNPITINGQSVTAKSGNLVLYQNKEFLFDGTKWIEMGDLSLLGALAYKNSASGTFTPSGSVSAPTITLKTAGSTAVVGSMDSAGSLPEFTATVANENLTLGWSAGSLPSGSNVTVKTGDGAYEADTPTFTGSEGTVTVS